MKRNAVGCCDCGDPTSWSPEGNCSKHKGQQDQDAEEILKEMPKKMRWAAGAVFGQLAREIKIYSMGLLSLDLQEPIPKEIVEL